MRAANLYRKNQTATAGPEEILLLLHDGAIRFLDEADEDLRSDRLGGAGERIGKVLAIVAELQAALDYRHSASLCTALDSLYSFMTKRLLAANAEHERGALAEVRGLLVSLREMWGEAAELVRAEQACRRTGFRSGPSNSVFAQA